MRKLLLMFGCLILILILLSQLPFPPTILNMKRKRKGSMSVGFVKLNRSSFTPLLLMFGCLILILILLSQPPFPPAILNMKRKRKGSMSVGFVKLNIRRSPHLFSVRLVE